LIITRNIRGRTRVKNAATAVRKKIRVCNPVSETRSRPLFTTLTSDEPQIGLLEGETVYFEA
jgi:hypothetical protein